MYLARMCAGDVRCTGGPPVQRTWNWSGMAKLEAELFEAQLLASKSFVRLKTRSHL